MKTDFFSSSHALFIISISSCAKRCIYDRLKIPIHAFTYFDRKRKEKCQADGDQSEEDYLIETYIVSFDFK
jgi:hypothetical protein